MFCLYCGNTLPEDALFCNRCGKRQRREQAVSTSGDSIQPGPAFPGTFISGGQPSVGNVPMVQGTPQPGTVPAFQGTPTIVHNSPGQSFAQSSPNAAQSAPPSVPPRITSEALQAPFPSTAHQTFPPSDLQLHHGVTSSRLKPTGFLSRRAVVLGLTVATAVVAGGGLTLAVRSGALKLPVLSNGTSGSHVPVPASFNVEMFGFDPQHTHFNPTEYILNPENVARLTLYWRFQTGGDIFSSPAIVNGVVYIGSGDHKVYGLDANTGKVLWTYATGNVIDSSPAVVNGIVYICSNKLYALSAKTGAVLWTYDTRSFIQSSPTVLDGIVYFCSNYSLYALDGMTGKPLWRYDSRFLALSSPAVVNGVVYFGSNDQSLYALDAKTGAVVWTYATGDATFSPAVANGVVYVGLNDQKLYALDAKTGAVLWSYATADYIVSSPAVANGVVYVGSGNGDLLGKLYALDAKTGTLLWSNAAGHEVASSPAVANGVVYVGSSDHNLYAFHLPG